MLGGWLAPGLSGGVFIFRRGVGDDGVGKCGRCAALKTRPIDAALVVPGLAWKLGEGSGGEVRRNIEFENGRLTQLFHKYKMLFPRALCGGSVAIRPVLEP